MNLALKEKFGNVVAIGGGHGLGRLLSALSFLEEKLTGIVTTTDNGGSTGRLRNSTNCIAWGDLRNCITQLNQNQDISSLLFEYRFDSSGELSGHNLGNLMLLALDNLCIRPLEAVNLIRELLHVKANIIPMAEQPSDLIALTPCGSDVHGEVSVDKMQDFPNELKLSPTVSATKEAVEAILNADVILLGPGSFLTSIMPPLLLSQMQSALNSTKAKVVFVDNLEDELGPSSTKSLNQKLEWCEKTVGFKFIDAVLQDSSINESCDISTYHYDLRESVNRNYHDRKKLLQAIQSIVDHI